MAIQARPSATSASISRATAGCSSRASNWASRAKRCLADGSSVLEINFTATDCCTPSMRSAR
jgi:hypothetical protein